MTPTPILTILQAVAPTVAQKIMEVIGDKPIKSTDVQTVIYAMMAEHDGKIDELMVKMDKRLDFLEKNCMTCSEGMVILLQRTKP